MPGTPVNALFLLHENIGRSLQLGSLGHLKEMGDLPSVGERFLLCDSMEKVVLGPFVVTRNQYYSETPLQFERRIGGTETETRLCHWLLDFAKVPEIEEREMGLTWSAASLLAGIPHDWWRNIRQNRMDKEQFEELCQALIEVNQGAVIPEGAVYFSEFADTSEEDYAFYYGEPVARYSSEGDPLNEEAFVQLMFNGDREAYESNWPDS